MLQKLREVLRVRAKVLRALQQKMQESTTSQSSHYAKIQSSWKIQAVIIISFYIYFVSIYGMWYNF